MQEPQQRAGRGDLRLRRPDTACRLRLLDDERGDRPGLKTPQRLPERVGQARQELAALAAVATYRLGSQAPFGRQPQAKLAQQDLPVSGSNPIPVRYYALLAQGTQLRAHPSARDLRVATPPASRVQ